MAAEQPSRSSDPRYTSIPLPLPPDVLTPEQWSIFAAIADAVVPSLTPAKGNRLLQHPLRADVYATARNRILSIAGEGLENGIVDNYLGENATAQSEFKHAFQRLLGYDLGKSSRDQFLITLSTLKYGAFPFLSLCSVDHGYGPTLGSS